MKIYFSLYFKNTNVPKETRVRPVGIQNKAEVKTNQPRPDSNNIRGPNKKNKPITNKTSHITCIMFITNNIEF